MGEKSTKACILFFIISLNFSQLMNKSSLASKYFLSRLSIRSFQMIMIIIGCFYDGSFKFGFTGDVRGNGGEVGSLVVAAGKIRGQFSNFIRGFMVDPKFRSPILVVAGGHE